MLKIILCLSAPTQGISCKWHKIHDIIVEALCKHVCPSNNRIRVFMALQAKGAFHRWIQSFFTYRNVMLVHEAAC